MAEIREFKSYGALLDLPCWEITVGESRVVVSSYGAHVLSYQVGTQPILWLSDTAVWQNGKAIRGGIPICWPWFGACPQELNLDNSAKPNHGIARTQFWSLAETIISDEVATLIFQLEEQQLPWVTGSVGLKYIVELTIESLTVTLQSSEPFAQQAALHTYFNVESSETSRVSPLPSQFYDKITDSITTSSIDHCEFKSEIDRIYTNTTDTLRLAGPNFQFEINQAGHDSSIVWNPGAIKAGQATDIAPNSWQQFVCVESAALNLSPRQLCLSQQIKNPLTKSKP